MIVLPPWRGFHNLITVQQYGTDAGNLYNDTSSTTSRKDTYQSSWSFQSSHRYKTDISDKHEEERHGALNRLSDLV